MNETECRRALKALAEEVLAEQVANGEILQLDDELYVDAEHATPEHRRQAALYRAVDDAVAAVQVDGRWHQDDHVEEVIRRYREQGVTLARSQALALVEAWERKHEATSEHVEARLRELEAER